MQTASEDLISPDGHPTDAERRRLIMVLALLFALSLSIGNGRSTAAETGAKWELPADSDAIVLELAYEASHGTPESVVAIHADGRVVISPVDGVRERQGRLTRAQLSELLTEIVDESSVLELQSEQVLRDVRNAAGRTGREWRISDASGMIVRVRLRDREHEVRCQAVEIWHERFPELESVADLCAIRRRLENVRAIVQVGGWETADELSRMANRELLRAFPQATPVTARELTMVRGRSEMRYSQFVTRPLEPGEEPLMISIFEFSNQPARFRIAPLPGT